jgi:hypothetical protein
MSRPTGASPAQVIVALVIVSVITLVVMVALRRLGS